MEIKLRFERLSGIVTVDVAELFRASKTHLTTNISNFRLARSKLMHLGTAEIISVPKSAPDVRPSGATKRESLHLTPLIKSSVLTCRGIKPCVKARYFISCVKCQFIGRRNELEHKDLFV